MTAVQTHRPKYTTLNDAYAAMIGPRWMASCRYCAQMRGFDTPLGIIRFRKSRRSPWRFYKYGINGDGRKHWGGQSGLESVRCPTCKTFRDVQPSALKQAVNAYATADHTSKVLI